jgi:autotransporter-associated beta strand protein
MSTVNGGTLGLASGTGSLATASSLVVDGGTFDAGGNTQALAGVQLTSGTIQNGTLVSASNYDVRGGTIGANLAGSAGLDKTTGASVIVSGSNSYSGDTNVLAGTLAIGGSDRANTGVVNIAAGATYRGSAGSFTNSGVIAGSGTLDVSGTSFTNSGTLRPGGAGAIGTLTVSGNATLSPTSLLEVEAQGAGNHDVVAITGAASLNGALSVTPINGYAPVNGDGLAPLTYASRTGTVYVATDRWLPSYNPTSLSLVFDNTLNRWVGTSGNWNVAANWSRGHVPVFSETVLIDVPGAQLVTVSDGWRFAGKLSAFEDFLISGGSLNLGGPSFFNAALTLTGGALQGPGTISANAAFNWSGGTLGGAGQFITSPTAAATLAPFAEQLRLNRNWLNQGSVTLAAAERATIKGDGAFQNDGTLNKIGPGKAAIKTSFSNSAGGTLNVESGVLKLEQSAANAGSINIAGGATLKLDGDFTNNGRISGSGAIEADTLFNRGVIAPGANGGLGIGTFRVLGDYYQGSTGVLEMGLGGTANGQFDVLAVSGETRLGGTLLGIAVNGYVPQPGQTFKLITYESRTGAFASVVGPAGFDLAPAYKPRFGLFTLD